MNWQARAAFEGAQAEPYASLRATVAYPPEAVVAAENRDQLMRGLRRHPKFVTPAAFWCSVNRESFSSQTRFLRETWFVQPQDND